MSHEIFDTLNDFMEWRRLFPAHEIISMTTFENKLIVVYNYKIDW